MLRTRLHLGRWTKLTLLIAVSLFGIGCLYYGLSPADFTKQVARVVLTPLFSVLNADDRDQVAALNRQYYVGAGAPLATTSWDALEKQLPGIRVKGIRKLSDGGPRIPFVYERPDAQYLRTLRTHYQLGKLVTDAPDEYSAMLALGKWLGTRWDHGTDPVPGGSKVCEPIAVIEDGEKGARYWCEIAARTTVQAATSLGWPARVITGSRDGYTWEHAVAELWSNQFDKWFVMDTDFNVVYEHHGVPLSAFELSRQGEALQARGELTTRQFAPPKPSLPPKNVLPFYAYVHVDLRNDWCSRPLHRASPAGGDLATWWTARPQLKRLLTAKVRVDDESRFDWKVNSVSLQPVSAHRGESGVVTLELSLKAYSPMFRSFLVKLNDGPWEESLEGHARFELAPGQNTISARVKTMSSYPGPLTRVDVEIAPASPPQLTHR